MRYKFALALDLKANTKLNKDEFAIKDILYKCKSSWRARTGDLFSTLCSLLPLKSRFINSSTFITNDSRHNSNYTKINIIKTSLIMLEH